VNQSTKMGRRIQVNAQDGAVVVIGTGKCKGKTTPRRMAYTTTVPALPRVVSMEDVGYGSVRLHQERCQAAIWLVDGLIEALEWAEFAVSLLDWFEWLNINQWVEWFIKQYGLPVWLGKVLRNSTKVATFLSWVLEIGELRLKSLIRAMKDKRTDMICRSLSASTTTEIYNGIATLLIPALWQGGYGGWFENNALQAGYLIGSLVTSEVALAVLFDTGLIDPNEITEPCPCS